MDDIHWEKISYKLQMFTNSLVLGCQLAFLQGTYLNPYFLSILKKEMNALYQNMSFSPSA
jgi:hypothetical protein